MKISAEEIKKIALLSRLEVKEDQMETVGKILNRLGLSGQMQWGSIITNDREAIKDAKKLIDCMNKRDFVMANKQLQKLKLKQ